MRIKGEFRDRREAGQLLAEKLQGYADTKNLIVLALPRGGVPVAFEIAKRLQAPLDIVMVRKLGVPGEEELAMGAVSENGTVIRNTEVISYLDIDERAIQQAAEKERRILRERLSYYRQGIKPPELQGREIIVVDDGLATGTTMLTAIQVLREARPQRIAVAVPVTPPDTYERIAKEVDDVVYLIKAENFFAVGQWYLDFTQTTDEEVKSLLQAAQK